MIFKEILKAIITAIVLVTFPIWFLPALLGAATILAFVSLHENTWRKP